MNFYGLLEVEDMRVYLLSFLVDPKDVASFARTCKRFKISVAKLLKEMTEKHEASDLLLLSYANWLGHTIQPLGKQSL